MVEEITFNALSGEFDVIDKYPYIYGYNFPLDPRYPETGKIDLILTDGNNHFLAIKVKFFGKISFLPYFFL